MPDTDAVIELPALDQVEPAVNLTPDPDPAPAADKPRKEAKVVTTDEGLEKLAAQLANESREKEAANTRARVAETDAAAARQAEATARGEVHDSRVSELTSAIARVKQNKQVLRNSYAEASAIGDHAKMAEIQEQMTEASVDLRQLERGKAQIEAAPKPVARPTASSDPVESFISTIDANSPNSKAWLRANPQAVTDPKLRAKLGAADQIARADGHIPDSASYLQSIALTLGIAGREDPAELTVDPDTAPQRAVGGRSAAPAAAPVSRGGQSNGSRPRTVRLTGEQIEMAKNMGMTNQEYAKHFQDLKDEGQIH